MLSIPRALIYALLVACMPAAAMAQTTSTLLGAVRDTSGGVLPGVSVTVKHMRTNASRTVVTGEDGNFVIPFLPSATTRSSASCPGFKMRSGGFR